MKRYHVSMILNKLHSMTPIIVMMKIGKSLLVIQGKIRGFFS